MPDNPDALFPAEAQRLIHELRVEALRTRCQIYFRVLTGLEVIIYAVDTKTNEIVFMNTYGRKRWGVIKRKIDWRTPGHESPGVYYTDSRLTGPDGNPAEGIVWEFRDTVSKRWYDCRSRAVYWLDGRIVRMEILTDITDRKQEEAVSTPKSEGGCTVLLVEDAEKVRKMTATMLRQLGFSVREAKDGIEALDVFRQHRDEICCVICDLTMPLMDGWDTLTALRRLSPDIPVILSSGYDEAHALAGVHPERPDAFIGKPLRLQELGNTIRHTLTYRKKTSP